MASFREQSKLKAVTLSYDDGVTQDFRLVELINKYNLKCTFNLNSGLMGKPGMLMRDCGRVSHYKIAAADVKSLYDGHEVAVHTLTHPHLPLLPDEEVLRQVNEDRLALSDLVGYEVIGMAYPGGGVNHDERVAKLIQENTPIRYARTILNTDSFAPQEDLFRFKPNVCHIQWDRLMDMAQRFVDLKTDKPQIFYIWGHSYEMDYTPESWMRLEEFFRFISGRSDIFYGTNKEVLL